MIILTTPKGLYTFDTHTNTVQHVLSGNFFGITRYVDNSVIVSEKIDEDFYIRFLDYSSFKDIRKSWKSISKDIHQILYYDGVVFITNTEADAINCYYPDIDGEHLFKETGYYGSDKHHINSLCIKDDCLYIGLNKNINNNYSSIAKVDLTKSFGTDILCNFERLNGVVHSHDLCEYNNDLLISASNQGYVYSYKNKKPLFYTSNSWTRGLVINEMGVWVGYSAVSVRKDRNKNLECSINRFEHDTFKHLGRVKIKSGQICDMLHMED